MEKKLSRYGNSLALIIDKPILELLHIKEDTILHIETDGESLFVSPKFGPDELSNRKMKDPKLQQIVEKILEDYSDALEKLED